MKKVFNMFYQPIMLLPPLRFVFNVYIAPLNIDPVFDIRAWFPYKRPTKTVFYIVLIQFE